MTASKITLTVRAEAAVDLDIIVEAKQPPVLVRASETVSADRLAAPPREPVSVGGAVARYIDSLKCRAEAGQVSWSTFRAMYQRLARMCEILSASTPLADVRQGVLQQCVLELAKRPGCRPAPHCRTAPARRISVATAAGRIAAAKSFFLWVSRDEELGWLPPASFNSIFRIDRRKMRTPEEQAARMSLALTGVKLLKLAQLARLHDVADERQRTFILLGLNCGFTSGEISSLATYEVQTVPSEWVIRRCRPKTGVEAQWALWPETAALLRAQCASPNPKQLWFLTRRGNTLVDALPTSRRDSIQLGWKELWSRYGIPEYLSFRHLRKTGADAVKRLGSLEDSEMYLAHQEPGLNKVYANRNWPKMWECLRQFRKELTFLDEQPQG